MPDPHPAVVRHASSLGDVAWFKSSASGETNACVTVAHLAAATAVRDSKSADGPAFLVKAAAWDEFLTSLR